MYKMTVTYEDFNGNTRTEDHFFNLNKAEIMEMEMDYKGGMTTMINRIIAAQDNREIKNVFKEMLLKSYGVKSDDGKRFIKNQEIRDEFEQSNAYPEIFMKLLNDPKEGANFVNGIIPKDMAKQLADSGEVDKILAQANAQ